MTTDKEDQFIPYKLNVPAAKGDKQTEVTLDAKTTRRMLAWVNAANRPEDREESRYYLKILVVDGL
jgi:hypothetical protein